MYLEYDWCFSVYRPRFGKTFTDVNGFRSFPTLKEAEEVLSWVGLRVGNKTDSRTWQIENID